MTVELMGEISNRRWMELKMDEPKNTLARAGYNITSSGSIGENWDRAHASHGSKGVNLWISIRGKCFLRRTTLRFSCDECHRQCYG
jgi:hypothetical protein